jgi:hypothetical protein
VPAPRSGHSAVALPGARHVLLFGGGDSDRDTFYSSLALLDTHTWRWSSVAAKARGCCQKYATRGESTNETSCVGANLALFLLRDPIPVLRYCNILLTVVLACKEKRTACPWDQRAAACHRMRVDCQTRKRVARASRHHAGFCTLQGVARPSSRAGHAAALLRLGSGRSALVVHGGRAQGDKLCKDTWLLELC